MPVPAAHGPRVPVDPVPSLQPAQHFEVEPLGYWVGVDGLKVEAQVCGEHVAESAHAEGAYEVLIGHGIGTSEEC
jgi:hypothetical protein